MHAHNNTGTSLRPREPQAERGRCTKAFYKFSVGRTKESVDAINV